MGSHKAKLGTYLFEHGLFFTFPTDHRNVQCRLHKRSRLSDICNNVVNVIVLISELPN